MIQVELKKDSELKIVDPEDITPGGVYVKALSLVDKKFFYPWSSVECLILPVDMILPL